MKKLRIAVLLSGGGTTLQNLIDCRAAGNLPADIELVVSSRASAKGLERARAAGIPTETVPSRDFRAPDGSPDWDAMSDRIDKILLPRKFDLICLAGFMCFYRIPAELRGKVINIHPALLPAFGGRGMWGHHVHEAVRASGVKISGCTVHYVTNDYDRGPIILQRSCPVYAEDSADDIAARVFAEECLAYPEAIRLIAAQRVKPTGRGVISVERDNLPDAAARAQTVLDHLPLDVITVDREMRIQEMNAHFRESFPALRVGDLLACFSSSSLAPTQTPVAAALADGSEQNGRMQAVIEGKVLHFEVRAVPLSDAGGHVTGAICISTDITRQVNAEKEVQKQKERYQNIMAIQDGNVDRLMHMQRELAGKRLELESKNEELQQLTVTDALTQLNNRRAFNASYTQEIRRAERYNHPLSVIFADIDHFRDFNNNFDYDTGDSVLCAIARALRSTFRDTDIITRYGGEEFVVVLPETNFAVVSNIAERLRKCVENTKVMSKHGELSVTLSIGTATVCLPEINGEKLLNLAVSALHEAKNTGRNRIVSRELK